MSYRQCYVLVLSFFAQEVYGELERRILEGHDVHIHWYQHSAFLHFKIKRPACCGGSVLTGYAIITAATCVEEYEYIDNGNITAYLGSTVPIEATVVRYVDNYRIHPKFNQEKLRFNLALLFVNRRIPLGHYEYIQRIPIAKKPPEPDHYLYTCGWGKQVETKKLPDYSDMRRLKATTQVVVPVRVCNKYFSFKMSYNFWCTESEKGYHYRGDAGNGLVTEDRYLVAVVSHMVDDLTVYSDVTRQRKWLAEAHDEMAAQYCMD